MFGEPKPWPLCLWHLIFLSSFIPLCHAQGDSGFLRGKGNLDLAISYTEDAYDSFWVGSNRVVDAPFGEVTRSAANLYGAYGLTDKIDLVSSLSYVRSETEAVFETEEDLQDLFLQVKWKAFSKDFAGGTFNFLLGPAIKVPVSHYEDNAVPALGDGQVDLRFRTIFQYVTKGGSFFALDTGYDFRFEETPNEVPIHLTCGHTFWNKVTVGAFISNISSQGGYDIGEGPFYGVEEEYTRYGFQLYFRLRDKFGLSVTGWTTSDGLNTGDVDGFSLGAVWRL